MKFLAVLVLLIAVAASNADQRLEKNQCGVSGIYIHEILVGRHKSVRQQKSKFFNSCRPTDFVSSDTNFMFCVNRPVPEDNHFGLFYLAIVE
jgi:hypothetical protein